MELTDRDYKLLEALEDGIPFTPEPYVVLGRHAGMGEAEVLATLERLCKGGVINRLGLVVHHRELGYTANGMVVWDIPDAEVARVAERLTDEPVVTLCYRRPRRLPDWPYNLFCMVHGREEADVRASLADMVERLGLNAYPHDILFSSRRFKQCGARYAQRRKVESIA
ncbi:MAG: AsnC family protein [Alphaproteobacteria bacterium]|nr:AsnC family protein [Alphaproteobacteria bacterium]